MATDTTEHRVPGSERRDFLYVATASTGSVVVGAAIWPLFDAMNPSTDVTALASFDVDISGIAPGSRITIKWRGKHIFIDRRARAAIARARAEDTEPMPDPERDTERVTNSGAEIVDPHRNVGRAIVWSIVICIVLHPGRDDRTLRPDAVDDGQQRRRQARPRRHAPRHGRPERRQGQTSPLALLVRPATTHPRRSALWVGFVSSTGTGFPVRLSCGDRHRQHFVAFGLAASVARIRTTCRAAMAEDATK